MRKMKDSGIEWIGQIPEDWAIIRLKRIAKIQTGNTPSKTVNSKYYCESGLMWVKPENLHSFKTIDSTKEYLNNDAKIIARVAPPCTPLVCCIGTIGKIGYSLFEVGYNQQINAISFKESLYNWKFGMYYLSSVEEQHWFYANGNVVQIINTENQGKILFSLPSIDEQIEITAFLDRKCTKIDETIEMEKQVIEKLKAYKQSVIREAVTKGLEPNVPIKESGIEWIGNIPEHWKAIKLKYEFKIKKNIAGKVGYDILSVTQKGIKIKDISNNEGQISMNYSKYQLVDVNDYVMNHMDLLTGFVDCSKYVGVTSPDYRVFSLINKKNSKEYFKYIFQCCYTNKIFYGLGQGVSGLGRWRLQTDKFLNFSLPIPQICEQDKIATYLNNKCFNIDNAISQKENLIEKLAQYKKSLIYECVTGKQEV